MKTFIKNRKGLKVSVLVEGEDNTKGLTFVMHGLSGNKLQPHIRTFVQAFLDSSYTVVSFDCTDSFGESEGNFEDTTVTGYYEDLEDVINWAKNQNWYKEPFILAGHSLGGICTTLYAENYPNTVKAIAPISTVVSGQLILETPAYNKEVLEHWKQTNYRIDESRSRPGIIRKLKWSYIENLVQYDALPKAKNLKMPVLMIVGDEDTSTPLAHQKIFFNALPGKKELHIIKGAPHTFREEGHLKEIKGIFSNWIKPLTS